MQDNSPSFPWPQASATGIGSLPGTDPAEAARLILGELPDLPHLAELPGRGPGADLTGRTAALLVDLPVETVTGRWRFAARPGRDMRRARDLLAADADALEEAGSGFQGTLKIQVCGPWTLAATVELARSQEAALADPGATADLTTSLAEGVAAHAAEVRKRVPGARILLQLDEPSLPAVLAGRVPTASGYGRLPAIEPADAQARLRDVLLAARAPALVHCCAGAVPFSMIKDAGADAVSFDLSQLRRGEEEVLAGAVEAGLGVLAGVVPAVPPAKADNRLPERAPGQPPSARQAAGRVLELWRRMGWATGPRAEGSSARAGAIAAQVVITPACGLAGATPGYARAALGCCREAARMLPELIEEEAG